MSIEARVKEVVAEQVNSLPPNPDLARDHYDRSFGYSRAGDYQMVMSDLTTAIQLGLSNDEILAYAYARRGGAYIYLDEYQNAINDYDKAIRLWPGVALWTYKRGIFYGKLGWNTLATADETTACSLDSQWC